MSIDDTVTTVQGFGLAHIKTEGAPLHPDDIYADLTEEQYATQLKAYNEYHKILT